MVLPPESQSQLPILSGPQAPVYPLHAGSESSSSIELHSRTSTPPDVEPSRKRLAELLNGPIRHSKKSKVAPRVPEDDDIHRADNQDLLRKLDVEIRWDTFIYHSNKFHISLIRRVYGDDIDLQSEDFLAARQRVYDNVKAYKHRVLNNIRVCST